MKYGGQKHFDQKNSFMIWIVNYCNLYQNCYDPYEKVSEIFVDILNDHASLKEKQIRSNHAPFMNKELSKAIMEKLKTINKYLKWPSRENYLSYKK